MGTTPSAGLELRYVTHRPGAWFLVAGVDAYFLDLRYSPRHIVDMSVLIRLDDDAMERWRTEGPTAIDALVERLTQRPPGEVLAEDLYRGRDSSRYRDAVAAAIADHTWAAEQRRRSGD